MTLHHITPIPHLYHFTSYSYQVTFTSGYQTHTTPISHLYHATSVSYRFIFKSHHISTLLASCPYHGISHTHITSYHLDIIWHSHHTISRLYDIVSHLHHATSYIYSITTLGHNTLEHNPSVRPNFFSCGGSELPYPLTQERGSSISLDEKRDFSTVCSNRHGCYYYSFNRKSYK